MKNLKELVKIFDKYIEFGESLIRVDDIVAIQQYIQPEYTERALKKDAAIDLQKVHDTSGIEIITPYGRFVDYSEKWNNLMQRISDIKEAMAISPEKAVETAVSKDLLRPTPNPHPHRKVEELTGAPGVQEIKTTIPVDDNSAVGGLGEVKVIDRELLKILSPTGRILGRSNDTGQVTGDLVSGVVMSNGAYRLAFQPAYTGDEAIIVCMIED